MLVRAEGPASAADWEALGDSPLLPDGGEKAALLIDLTHRESLPDGEVIDRATDVLVRLAPRLRAVAMLARPGAQFGCARMVDSVAGLRVGLRAAVFSDEQEARRWLAEGPADGEG